MTKIKYIDTNDFDYVPSETAFLECTRITNLKTGVTESLTGNDKDFYVRMRHRYYYFVKELGGTYYDNVDQLGQSIGVSPATATRIVAKLKKIGLISSENLNRSNQWTVTPLTPDNFLLERDRNVLEDKADPEWVDCLKHPVFGNAKEDVALEVQEEKQQTIPEADPMCEFDDTPEEEAPAPEKVEPAPKTKRKPEINKPVTPSAAPSDDKEYSTKLRQFESAGHWYQFSEYQLPDLERFKLDGKLTNEYALAYLDKHTSQQIMNT